MLYEVITKKIGEDAPQLIEAQAEEPSPEEEEYILCRQCHQAITRPAERISRITSYNVCYTKLLR